MEDAERERLRGSGAEPGTDWQVWGWEPRQGASEECAGRLAVWNPSTGRTMFIYRDALLDALSQAGLLPKGGEA